MKTKLMPTQEVDVSLLLGKDDLPNFSSPGTGKTLTTVGAIEAMGLQSGRVVCPVIAVPMWARVLEHELDAKVQILKSGTTKIDKTADFHIMSYSMASAHFKSLIVDQRDALVLDESHYLKTPTAARTRAVFGAQNTGEGGLFECSKYCFTLTGTPVDRYQDDMWAQLRAIQPDLLHKYHALALGQFKELFTSQAMKQFNPRMKPVLSVVSSRNEKLFNKMVYEDLGAIQRVMADVDNLLPPVTFRHIGVEFQPDPELKSLLQHKTLYDIITLVEGGDLAMAKARRLLGVAKAPAVASYVMEQQLRAGSSVLVGYWHQEVGETIASLLRREGIAVERIGGDTELMERDAIAERFNSGETKVVVGQIAAAGVSLNLQKLCRHVVLAEVDWSPGRMEQFYKRVHRLGQKGHVQVDYCMADHPLDTAAMLVLDGKQRSINIGRSENNDYGYGKTSA